MVSNNTGRVSQVIGSTLDAEFDEDKLPAIYNALQVDVEPMTCETRPVLLRDRRTLRWSCWISSAGRMQFPDFDRLAMRIAFLGAFIATIRQMCSLTVASVEH